MILVDLFAIAFTTERMRLLDTTNLQLKEFPEDQLPLYWILSHRWRAEEVEYDHIQDLGIASNRLGWAKLQSFCDLVKSQNPSNKEDDADYARYAWIDTCCINKANPTELGEAINSMFRWYGQAAFCVAYLDDVHSVDAPFNRSEWFDRGWTLQELIAPEKLGIYSSNWDLIGLKKDLAFPLAHITGIPTNILEGTAKLKDCSIAQRMSWAAKRKTQRPEDMAYSLLGIFGVSLPTVYGSGGEQAFRDLQEKIMTNRGDPSSSNDQSIFAWENSFTIENNDHGLLAHHPKAFEGCNEVLRIHGVTMFKMEQLGVAISLKTLPYVDKIYLAVLECRPNKDSTKRMAILVKELPDTGLFARVKYKGIATLATAESRLTEHNCVIRPLLVTSKLVISASNIASGFHIHKLELPGFKDRKPTLYSSDGLQENASTGYIYFKPGSSLCAGIGTMSTPSDTTGNFKVDVGNAWWKICWMKFAFDVDFNPMILLANRTSRFAGSLNPQYDFSKAITADVDSAERQNLFGDAWTNRKWTVKSRTPTTLRDWLHGCTILRGNKDKNVSWRLESLNLRVSLQLKPILTESEGRKIWTVEITELGCGSPQSRVRKKNFEAVVVLVATVTTVFTWACLPCLPMMARNVQAKIFNDEMDTTEFEDT